jgi:hypothetical protein
MYGSKKGGARGGGFLHPNHESGASIAARAPHDLEPKNEFNRSAATVPDIDSRSPAFTVTCVDQHQVT